MVGRPAYQITAKDYAAARRYIENAMARDDVSRSQGYMLFQRANTPTKLQAWCDDYLPTERFGKMKKAILAARKRQRDYENARTKIGVDLDRLAHLRLASLADELGQSLSQTILLMEEAYWVAKDNGLLAGTTEPKTHGDKKHNANKRHKSRRK